MVIEDQPAWAPHLRSRARLRKAPKRHFVDPSLALAAVGAAPERLLQDLEWFGQVFESLVIPIGALGPWVQLVLALQFLRFHCCGWDGFFRVFGISRKRVASFAEPVKKLGDRRGFMNLFQLCQTCAGQM